MQPLNYLKHITFVLLLATLTTTMSPMVSALTFTEKESSTTPTTPTFPSPRELSPGQATSTYMDPTGRSVYNETVVDSTTQTFTWTPVPNASKYALYVRNLDTNALIVMEENLTTTSYATSTLSAGYHYKWSVRAKDSQGRGGWMSDGYYFKVKEGVAEIPPPLNDKTMDIYILDENDNPIVGRQIIAQATCSEINLCYAGITDLITDAYGKVKLRYSLYKQSSIKVNIGYTNTADDSKT